MSANVNTFYEAALKYTKSAGELVLEKISLSKNVALKSSEIDLVTETDQQVEKLLIQNLSKDFPDHKFIGEESVAGGSQCTLTDSPTWIIDPIDGTMNFVHTFPHSCISIALFIEKKPEVAIIYNPMLDQLFTAKRGQGAYLNGKKIQVSKETDFKKALVMMEFGTSRDPEKMKAVMANQNILITQVHGLRALGSAALDMAMVALGAADAYFEFGIHIWDFAAGELIVTEAGGVVMDPSGGPVDRFSRRILVANCREIAEQLSKKIVQYHPTPRD
ncbi:inositol monophosphatase 1 [Tribolium castaneum]|uniref:inositol monophosphatase 1 n=1 Tax=Tribolium castaneum TaxID=7070 RepID=UPI0030FEF445